ncbi:ribonuclease III [Phellopilus nigrolimitatus]|nr:ribonuclease III [Phellopilus nigrolimitatus]
MKEVMQDFFRITDKLSRPRIFGIIIPPPDTKFYFDVSLLKVERILNAQVHGVTNSTREVILTLPDKPMEIVVYYDAQARAVDTTLLKHLHTIDPRMSIFRSHFRNAKHALGEVGACACDLVWRRALKDMEAEVGSDEPVYEEDDELQAGSEAAIRKAKSNIRDAIKNCVFTMPNLDPTSRGFNVTPKFAKLMQILKACQPQGEAFRGIIFVQKRSIAHVLVDLLRNLDDRVGFLRPQALVGHGPSADPSIQADILDGFKNGSYNLLVATKYAEDLEISPATVVIRFDLFESQISYAHCRARARGQECHLIHMAERGSDVHRRILSQIARIDSRMERWVQEVATNPESAIPPYPLRETVDPYRSDSDDEDEDPAKFVQDPTTSGRVYVQDATTVVYRFVSQLSAGAEKKNDKLDGPLFEYEELQDGSSTKLTYICTILLPSGSPVRRVSGPPCSSMAQARRTACYQTCFELYRRGALDYRLFPRPPLPTSRPQRAAYISVQMVEEMSDKEEEEAQLPTKMKQGQNKTSGTRPYPRKRPDFWTNTLPIMRGHLYPTIVVPVVDSSVVEGGGVYSPILLLTRLPLPPISPMKIFFSGTPGKVHFKRAEEFEIDKDRLEDIYKYTIRVIRCITNRPYICALDNMTYFLAPLPRDYEAEISDDGPDDGQRWDFPNVVDHIPWDKIQLAAEKFAVVLNSQDLETLIEDTDDAMIQDRWAEFTRRYFCVRMRPDLTPLSKPEDSPRERDYDNLVEYCRARRKGFGGLQNYKQPVIEVERTPMLINHLSPTSKPINETKHHPAKYLIPELCAKCTIPASIFRTASLLPSIVNKLEDMLLIKELNAKYFDHSITESHLHAAVSAPAADVEFDYERLELLGDAYLKYLSSVYLFVTFPTSREGALHISRQRIISNRSLLRNANRCGLPQYIQSKPFTPKNWFPLNFFVYRPPKEKPNDQQMEITDQALEEGELPAEESTRFTRAGGSTRPTNPMAAQRPRSSIRKRSTIRKPRSSGSGTRSGILNAVADVAEAIIGAAYVTGGREVALKVTKALNVPVPHIDRWSDFGRKALAPPPEVTAKLRTGTIQAVETIIGHQFNHKHLLAQALTHASIHGNEMTSYERLEFIGDAILDFLVIRHIFDRDNALSPGELTLMKGAMVSNAALAAVCVWSGLHEHLLFESSALEESIQAYADALEEKQRAAHELAAKEKRLPGQYWVEIEPPKALSDVIESIFGAVYVSDNFSPVGAETFFDKVLAPFFDQHITLHTLSHHPTKILFEFFQSQGCQEFELVKESVDSDNEFGHTSESKVVIHDIILASATDISASAAARRASDMALDALAGDPHFMSRNCDCRVLTLARKAAKKALKSVVTRWGKH